MQITIKNNKKLTLNQFLKLPRKSIKRIINDQENFRGDFE